MLHSRMFASLVVAIWCINSSFGITSSDKEHPDNVTKNQTNLDSKRGTPVADEQVAKEEKHHEHHHHEREENRCAKCLNKHDCNYCRKKKGCKCTLSSDSEEPIEKHSESSDDASYSTEAEGRRHKHRKNASYSTESREKHTGAWKKQKKRHIRDDDDDDDDNDNKDDDECNDCFERHDCDYCRRKYGCKCKDRKRNDCKKCLKHRECDYCSKRYGCDCENDCDACLEENGCDYCLKHFGCKCREKQCGKCLEDRECEYCHRKHDCECGGHGTTASAKQSAPECRKCFEPRYRRDATTWKTANELCMKEGYKLASVRSAEENKNMIEEIKKRNITSAGWWLAGGCHPKCKKMDKTVWYWTDNPEHDLIHQTWENWKAAYPSIDKGQAVITAYLSDEYQWRDNKNENISHCCSFVCERPCHTPCQGGPKELQSMVQHPTESAKVPEKPASAKTS